MNDNLSEEFHKAILLSENKFISVGFKKPKFEKVRDTYFVKFEGRIESVEFYFGASDFQVEFSIIKNSLKFAFKDLLTIPEIKDWINENKYIQKKGRCLENEVKWFSDLIIFSLPIL